MGLVSTVTPALADQADEAVARLPPDPSLETIVGGAVNRGRRALVIGPTLSAGVSISDTGDLDVPLSGGLALQLYDIPIIPDRAMIEDIIKGRVTERLKERIADAMQGRQDQLSDGEVESLAREVYQDVKEEVLGLNDRRSKVFEKPRLHISWEFAMFPRAEAYGTRITARYGIGPISIGPVVSAYKFERVDLLLGGEIAVAAMPNAGARANAYELAFRVDSGLRDVGIGFSLGLRAVFDLI